MSTSGIAEQHDFEGLPGARTHSTPRIARLVAFNESVAIANHALADVKSRAGFVCECGSLSCRTVVRLGLSEYERIRRGLLRLVGHEDPG
jgi:hypothetical protein